MFDEICVGLIEDDFFARSWMEQLLMRDWRTRVKVQIFSLASCIRFLSKNRSTDSMDMIILNPESAQTISEVEELFLKLEKYSLKTKVIFFGMSPNPLFAELFHRRVNFAGYLLKNEIRDSLAWAVVLADDYAVITPGVRELFTINNPLPTTTLIVDGREPYPNMTELDYKRARMVFIFSMERHEFANEESVSIIYSYGLVSEFYEKASLNELLSERQQAEKVIITAHPILIPYLNLILKYYWSLEGKYQGESNSLKAKKVINFDLNKLKHKKGSNMETLAFHFFCLPKVETID